MRDKIPSRWISASFFVWAILFAVWQPLVWWRIVAAIVMVCLGLYGFFLWWKGRSKDKPQRTDPPLRSGADDL